MKMDLKSKVVIEEQMKKTGSCTGVAEQEGK